MDEAEEYLMFEHEYEDEFDALREYEDGAECLHFTMYNT